MTKNMEESMGDCGDGFGNLLYSKVHSILILQCLIGSCYAVGFIVNPHDHTQVVTIMYNFFKMV